MGLMKIMHSVSSPIRFYIFGEIKRKPGEVTFGGMKVRTTAWLSLQRCLRHAHHGCRRRSSILADLFGLGPTVFGTMQLLFFPSALWGWNSTPDSCNNTVTRQTQSFTKCFHPPLLHFKRKGKFPIQGRDFKLTTLCCVVQAAKSSQPALIPEARPSNQKGRRSKPFSICFGKINYS